MPGDTACRQGLIKLSFDGGHGTLEELSLAGGIVSLGFHAAALALLFCMLRNAFSPSQTKTMLLHFGSCVRR